MRFLFYLFLFLLVSGSAADCDCDTPLTLHVIVLHDNRFMLGHGVDLLINFEDVHILPYYSYS